MVFYNDETLNERADSKLYAPYLETYQEQSVQTLRVAGEE